MRILLIAAAACVLASCGAEEENKAEEKAKINKLNDLAWIKGDWEMKTPEGTVREFWKAESDSVWAGLGLFLGPAGDTFYSEHIKLEQRGDTLYYIPAVSNQNDGKPIMFKEASFTADEVVFENKLHDFPQRIVYKKTSDSTISARVEGMQEGKSRTEGFDYVRSK